MKEVYIDNNDQNNKRTIKITFMIIELIILDFLFRFIIIGL